MTKKEALKGIEERKSSSPLYNDEQLVNMLSDVIEDMRSQLKTFQEKKNFDEDSAVIRKRKELISFLDQVYLYIGKIVFCENVDARLNIKWFIEDMEKFVLDDGILPLELFQEQSDKFTEHWKRLKRLNEETKSILKRSNIE